MKVRPAIVCAANSCESAAHNGHSIHGRDNGGVAAVVPQYSHFRIIGETIKDRSRRRSLALDIEIGELANKRPLRWSAFSHGLINALFDYKQSGQSRRNNCEIAKRPTMLLQSTSFDKVRL